ncbi:DUF6069 family protein [Nocardiopsis protaetiae]|uniref:DUF6069 family protein n=1 Tax=Nocardiopsis protaetiae TaxID=3382270 RepID=UPI00387AF6EC
MTAAPAVAPPRASWRPRLAAVAAVAVANALLALVAPLLGADLVVAPPGQDPAAISAVAFAIFSAGFALLGWGVLALGERFLGRRGLVVWTVVAVLVALLMVVPPLSAGGTVATTVVLELSHLVVAAVVIPVFWKSSKTT